MQPVREWACLLYVRWGRTRNAQAFDLRIRSLPIQLMIKAMTDHKADRSFSFRPSVDTDDLRPALLLAGTQVMIALLGAVLLTNGALA